MNRSPAARDGESDGPTKRRPHAEMRVESPGANGRLERPEVNVEFAGQLVKRQQLVLSLCDCATASRARWSTGAGTARRPLSHVRKVSRGTDSSAANSRCPSPVARRRSRTSSMLRTRCHSRRRSPSDLRHVMAGDQRQFRAGVNRLKCATVQIAQGNRRSRILRSSGANSQDRSLFSMKLRLRISCWNEIGEFFRKWRARQDSNLRPPA